MVEVSIPAMLRCDHPNCGNAIAVKLVLLMPGGFGIKTPGGGWQVGGAPENPFGAMMGRCPTHNVKEQKVQAVTPKIIQPH